jgi:hypothetical protein
MAFAGNARYILHNLRPIVIGSRLPAARVCPDLKGTALFGLVCLPARLSRVPSRKAGLFLCPDRATATRGEQRQWKNESA